MVVMVVIAVGTVDMAADLAGIIAVVVVVAIGAVDMLGGGWLAVGSVGGHGSGSLIGTSISIEL